MALLVKTGTYTGPGGTSGTFSVTGVGFQPKFVFVWTDDAAEIYPVFTWASALAGRGTSFGYWGENGWFTLPTYDRFQSLDADGFTVSIGSSTTASQKALAKSGATFHYLCLGGDDVVTGSYTGNGANDRNITGVGFQPEWVMLMGGTQHQVHKMDSSGAATDQSSYMYNGVSVADRIQALQSDGFQVGTNIQANGSGTVYYYVAIKASSDFSTVRYTGDGTDNRSITGVGFEPDFVLIKATSGRNPVLRSDTHAGDLSKYYRSVGFAANYIQAFEADGFQLGSAGDVNLNGTTFDAIALRTGVVASSIKPQLLAYAGI